MSNDHIDIIEFKKAIDAFKIAVESPKTDMNRDATIQRFEFCVELSWKTAKKVLGLSSTSPKTVIREMAQDGLIQLPEKWLEYIELRNLSAHTYKEELAEKVYNACPGFLGDVLKLFQKLEEKIS